MARSLQERLQKQLDGEDAFTLKVDLLVPSDSIPQLNVSEIGRDFLEGSTPDGDTYLIPFNNITRIKVEF